MSKRVIKVAMEAQRTGSNQPECGRDRHRCGGDLCGRAAGSGRRKACGSFRHLHRRICIELAAWLKACRIDTVAMEATGVYWIPLYDILEGG